MRRLLLLAPFLLAAVPDRAPPPIVLTPDEQATVDRREIAVRFDPLTGSAAEVSAVVDVAAPIDATWAALLNLEARVGEVGGLLSLTRTVDQPDRIGARWRVRVLTTTVAFTVIYELDPANHFVRFHLDHGQANDLVAVEGAYQLYAVGDETRFVYWSQTDSGHAFPAWVKKWVATSSLGEQLNGIRSRAEAAR